MKYLVKELSFVEGVLVQPGTVVDYDLPEGTTVSANLEPYKEPKGRKAADSADASGDGAQ